MRKFIFLLLIHSFMWQITATATSTPTEGYLKFGPKFEYHGFFWSTFSIGEGQSIGLFVASVSKRKRDALLYSSTGWEIGLLFRSIHIGARRQAIHPQAPFRCCDEPSIPLYVKSIHIPIIGKFYIGKRRRFCWLFGCDISFMLTAKALDPEGEFMQSAAYAALDEKDKKGYWTPAYKEAYDTFHTQWKRRGSKYSHIPVQTIFASWWHLGLYFFGIGYEMDMGFSFHYMIPTMATSGMTGHLFTASYDLNRWIIPALSQEKRLGTSRGSAKSLTTT